MTHSSSNYIRVVVQYKIKLIFDLRISWFSSSLWCLEEYQGILDNMHWIFMSLPPFQYPNSSRLLGSPCAATCASIVSNLDTGKRADNVLFPFVGAVQSCTKNCTFFNS